MGITGLLPFLKNASRPSNVTEMSGKVAAVDVYCWLHKGAFGCAERLVQGQKTDGHVVYVMRYVDLLLRSNIKPILVFDGRNLPSKSGTERKRRENREKFRKMAKDYLLVGNHKAARECFQRCIDITPEMALEVINACNERNIDCIVAPYEADAQLAFLNVVASYADFVISEDSDLALFGCDKILFKLDSNGNGILYERKNLHLALGQRAESLTFEKFRYMGIMAGCDYLSSLHGIGIRKSCKFWSKIMNPNLETVLPKIPSYLNMHHLKVSKDYIQGFVQANQTFLYQVVFDPMTRTFRPLNDYPTNSDYDFPSQLDFAGEIIDRDIQLDFALGNLNVHSLKKVREYRPQSRKVSTANGSKTKYGKRVLDQKSIWEPDYDPLEGFQVHVEATQLDKAARKAQESTVAIKQCFSKKVTLQLAKLSRTSSRTSEETLAVNEKPTVASVCGKKLNGQPKPTEAKVKYVSKHFVSPPAKRKAELEGNSSGEEESGGFGSTLETTQREVKKPNSVGDWLAELDEPRSQDERDLPHSVSNTSDGCVSSRSVLATPFKPPALVTKPEESTKKRNPFAKSAISPPAKKNRDLENSSLLSNSPPPSRSADSGRRPSEKPIAVIESPPKRMRMLKTFVADASGTSSPYFSGEKRKVSTIKQKTEQRQKSLLEMWSQR